MTSRDRVSAAIEYRYPDRLPIMLEGWEWKNANQCPENQTMNDIYHCGVGFYNEGFAAGRNIDNWHCEWLNMNPSYLGQVVGHPLADLSALSDYRPPDPMDMSLFHAADMAENRGDKYVVLGYISLFERLINLRGFEELLMDIAVEADHFFIMRDMVLIYNLQLIDRLLTLNPDAIYLADDWGSQISLLISPALWRKLFLPAYKRMIDRARNAGKHVFFHSDGYVLPILPDLIEAGVNVFWSELGVNPIEELRKCAVGRAAYLSLYDTQYLERSSPDELAAHVEHCLDTLSGPQGGYIAMCDLGDSFQSRIIYNICKNRRMKPDV